MPETMTGPVADLPPYSMTEVVPPRLEGATERAFHLDMLPAYGFDGLEAYRAETIDRIVSVGLPVDNFTSLARWPNKRGTEDEYTLGSWGIAGEYKGQFSVYELLDRVVVEKQLGTIAHEGAHANSPLVPENTRFFGSEAERLEAATFARESAKQALATRKYLNGYHAYLAEQLDSGEIDEELFAEETWAITTELALTNRQHLAQVETAQHNALDKQVGAGQPRREKVYLMSREGPDGAELAGVDKALTKLVDGVTDHASLLRHTESLKARFYPDETLAVAYGRGTVNPDSLTAQQMAFIMALEAQAFLDEAMRKQMLEDRDRKSKSKEKSDKKRATSKSSLGLLALR